LLAAATPSGERRSSVITSTESRVRNLQLRMSMSQEPLNRHSDWSRTLHGFEREAESPLVRGFGGEKFVPVGARVGKGGQVFETNVGAGLGDLVVKLFTWGAELPERVVRDFTREAMTVASLRHPHIARIVDAGTMGDGTPFVIMERLVGITLEEVASRGPLPTAEIGRILRGIASALSAAHAVGIAHGQVRADNVFIAQVGRHERPCPKLLDFGVARLAAGGRAIGPGGTDVGSARPELELGGRAGERADQLALATLARRLIGGVPTPAVEQVLFRATSADPSRRFGTIMAFIETFENAFENVSNGVSPTNVSAMTIPMGAIPGSASRPVSFGTPLRVAANSPSSSAPATAIASSPSSLTQQFFADGDQLDSAHAGGHADHAETNVEEEDDGDLGTRARVPRSRPQMILAAALALGSVALIAGTVIALADKPAGRSPTAQISPLAGVVRPDALPAPSVQSRPRALEREGGAAVVVSRRLRRPSAPAKAAVTPAGSPGPAAVELSAPPTPPAAAAQAATAATDRRPPEVTPAAQNNEAAAQPANEATSAPVQEPPKPSDPESEPAVQTPETESPSSVPEPLAPAAAMERV
jgi:serine/threonine protein kinase